MRLIVEMLKVLGKAHVVEGVETQDVFDVLVEIGYTTFQGYLIAKPMPLSEFLTAPVGRASS
jgi:EAL domain-containing protein (putative c-di-GMP-specific phosphodiesterase class I)